MKKYIVIFITLLAAGHLFIQDNARAQTGHQNGAKNGLAIKGYDPVSYHRQEVSKGSKQITAEHKGLTYRFVSEDNRKTFEEDPAKYEPVYGGWCAWAMLEGDKVDINPKRFKIINGRTYLFYDGFFGNTLKKWNEKAEQTPEPQLVEIADQYWQKITAQ